jgi:hypothetical protein
LVGVDVCGCGCVVGGRGAVLRLLLEALNFKATLGAVAKEGVLCHWLFQKVNRKPGALS